MQGPFHWRNGCQESVGSFGRSDVGGQLTIARKFEGEEVAKDTDVDGRSH